MEVLSWQSSSRYKLSAISAPKYKAGDDWSFVSDFKDMIGWQTSSHQGSLKTAVSEEAKRLLYQEEVETVEHAFTILTELYQPLKYSSTLMQEILKITQLPNERLRVLAGTIEDASRKYAETLELPSTDLDKLIKSCFEHVIVYQGTKNQLLWDQTDIILDKMVQKPQQFEDCKNSGSAKPQKLLRMTERSSETSQLCKQIEDLQKQIGSLQAGKKRSSSSEKQSFVCWYCGKKGQLARNCKEEKVGDGFTFRPMHQSQASQKDETLY